MANGQQKSTQNLTSFLTWQATMTDEGYRQIIFRGALNRGDIAKACLIGKSALNQNPHIKNALKELEDDLRCRGVLPPLTVKAEAESGKPKEYDNTANSRMMDSKRVSLLEQENIELKAEVNELKKELESKLSKLERFGELSEALAETGMMPR